MSDLLTIVFPTYNRGHLLVKTLKKISTRLPARTSVMVLDNGSNQFKEEYEEVKSIASASDRINYSRNEENLLFEGNFSKAFESVATNYLMFISDEDAPKLDFIKDNMPLFENVDAYGAIRPSVATDPSNPATDRNATTYLDKCFVPGVDALCDFGISGNYLSGAIYNAHLIKTSGLHDRLKSKLVEQRFYPHLYLNSLISTRFSTRYMSEASVFIGDPAADPGGDNSSYGLLGTLAYGHRLDAFIAARDAISEALNDGGFYTDLNFFTAYLNLVRKYMRLIIGVNGVDYQNLGRMEILSLADSFTKFCMSAASLHSGFEDYAGFLERSIIEDKDQVLKQMGVVVSSKPSHNYGPSAG